MLLVTNPGSNLSARAVAYYQVQLTPQKIVVDGEQHDTREPISFETLDEWVRRAKVYPHPLGTSAAESAEVFKSLLAQDRELLVVTTSAKLVRTYTASFSAAKMLMAAQPDAVIDVVDSGVTDIGAGLCVMFAGEAIRAGVPPRSIPGLVADFAAGQRSVMAIKSLDYLVKSGRASFLKAWLADIMSIVPILAFEEGEVKALGRIGRNEDRVAAIENFVTRKVKPGTPAWVAVVHANEGNAADDLMHRLRARFDVRFGLTRAINAGTYLGGGPGTLAAFVFPIDRLRWTPTTPAVT